MLTAVAVVEAIRNRALSHIGRLDFFTMERLDISICGRSPFHCLTSLLMAFAVNRNGLFNHDSLVSS